MSESKVSTDAYAQKTSIAKPHVSDNSSVTEWIKSKIEDEGIQARNIIKYNVPVEINPGSPRRSQPCVSPRDSIITVSLPTVASYSPRRNVLDQEKSASTVLVGSLSTTSPSAHSNSFSASSSSPSSPRRPRNGPSLNGYGGTIAPVAVRARSSIQIEGEYRARYWGQMLETLRRTIDEIYSACETDESELECREVIMILEHSKHDFHSLIEKMNLLRDYEKADARNKPCSLAWDERNTLPCKPIMYKVLASAVAAGRNNRQSLSSIMWTPSSQTAPLPFGDDGIRSNSKPPSCPEVSWQPDGPSKSVRMSRFPMGIVPSTVVTSSGLAEGHSMLGLSTTPTNLSTSSVCHPAPTEDGSIDNATALDNHGVRIEAVDDAEYVETSYDEDEDTTQGDIFVVGEVDDDGDADDNTLSRDLRQLDEAIANVTTAERVLSDQLDRAHLAEAVLRRRLIAEEQQNVNTEAAGVFDPRRSLNKRIAECHVEESLPSGTADSTKRKNELLVDNNFSAVDELDTDADLFDLDDLLDEEVENETGDAGGKLSTNYVEIQERGCQMQPPVIVSLTGQSCCACDCHGDNATDPTELSTPGISSTAAQCQATGSKSGTSTVSSKQSNLLDLIPKDQVSTGDVKLKGMYKGNGYSSPVTSGNVEQQQNVGRNLGGLKDKVAAGVDEEVPQLLAAQRRLFVNSANPLAGPSILDTQSLLFLDEPDAKSRVPGHGIQMHEKLSSRTPRRSVNSIQELEQKQARARSLRQRHLLERADRVHELSKKVEEVHVQKRLLLHQRRSCLERRLHAAERKRQAELERRVLKAHDEETKGREIAFIQTLEAEQKQHSILTKHEESRARLHELAAERRRRLEEKLCREEAAKGRRRALEASRRARLDALQARWESRAQQLASRAELLEHSRRAAAKAKEQYREIKMASLEEQQRTHIERLRSKIERKQIDSERRHQETLREISRKAFEMSVLTHTGEDSVAVAAIEPYPIQKWCLACRALIVSEVSLKSHLHGKQHKTAVVASVDNRPLARSDWEAFNLEHIVDAPPDLQDPSGKVEQERTRMRRKRTRRLRQRMNQRGQQFLQELQPNRPLAHHCTHNQLIYKLVKDARRLVNLPDSGPWVVSRVQAMEKTLNSLLRCLSGDGVAQAVLSETQSDTVDESMNRQVCIHLGLLPILVNFVGLMRLQKPSATYLVPDKTCNLAFDLLLKFFLVSSEACYRLIFSNDVAILVDCLVSRFTVPAASSARHSTLNNMADFPPGNVDAPGHGPFPGGTSTLLLMDCLTAVLEQLADDWQTRQFTQSQTGSCAGDSWACGTASIVPPLVCTATDVMQRYQDLISYIVSTGLVDLLSARLSNPRQAHWLQVPTSATSACPSATPTIQCQRSPVGSGQSYASRSGCSNSQQQRQQNRRFVLSCIALLNGLLRLLGCLPRAGGKRPAGCALVISSPHDCSRNLDRRGSLSVVDGTGVVLSNGVMSTDQEVVQGSPSCSPARDSVSVTLSNAGTTTEDPTRLLETVVTTEMFGLVPLLYCLLLDPVNSSIVIRSPDLNTGEELVGEVCDQANLSGSSKLGCASELLPFPSYSIGLITLQSLKLFNSLAMVNQGTLQAILSGDLTCLLTRHILLNLMSRCVSMVSSSSTSPPSLRRSMPAASNRKSDAVGRGVQLQSPSAVDKKSTTRSAASVSQTDLLPSGARLTLPRPPKPSTTRRLATYELPSWVDEPTLPTDDIVTTDSVTSTPVSKMKGAVGFGNYRPLSGMPTSSNCLGQENTSSSHRVLTTTILHEVVLCIGHLCALHPENQISLQVGPPPSLLQRLVALPFEYFSQQPLTDLLYPTLIAFCYAQPGNKALLEAELNPTLLVNYIEEHRLQRTMEALSSNTDDKKVQPSATLQDNRWRFEHRFPVNEWNSAKEYFSK